MYFTFNFSDPRIIMCFLTSPLALGIFLSASLIFFSWPDLSVFYWVFKTNSLVSMVLILVTDSSYTVFWTIIFTTLLSLLNSTGTVFKLSISKSSTSDFKATKSAFQANFDVSMLVSLFKSDFVA